MPVTLDTLAYAQKLRAGGVPQEQAEVHASAVREFIADPMADFVTRADLDAAVQQLRQEAETQTYKLTVRFGIMLAGALTLLFGALRFHL